MRFLIVGVGSIGSRHGRNLAGLGHQVLIWDVHGDRLREAAAGPGIEAATSLDDALAEQPDAVLVCTPPALHLEVARRALAADAHLFVEKPLAHVSEGVPALIDEARRRGRVLAVGFNLRFLPSLRHVKALLESKRVGNVLAVRAEFGAYLPAWRAGRDYRDNYAVHAAQGGGILLDAIHELDYLGWFHGEATEVVCTAGHWSDLAGDTEDLAEVTLRFESGVLAQVHLDYVQRRYRRNLQVIGDAGVIVWDYPTHSVTVYGAETSSEETIHVDDGDPNNMYLEEVRHFIRCLEAGEPPNVDGVEALRSIRLVEAAKRSARERRAVRL
jgi:predicted dehydrogenase